MLCKGWGEGWEELTKEKIAAFNAFIGDVACISESNLSKTNLFLFTEQDEEYNMVFRGPDWEEFKETPFFQGAIKRWQQAQPRI